MKALECSQHFSHYNPMGAISCHGNQFQSDLAQNLMQPFPHPNDASDKIWLPSAHWSPRGVTVYISEYGDELALYVYFSALP